MRILLTGSEGNIGRYFKYKMRKKYELFTLDIRRHPDIFCDVRYMKKLKRVFEQINPDVVIHMAAGANIKYWDFDEVTDDSLTNIIGTKNVLSCMAGTDKLLIFTSSGMVYGDLYDRLKRPIKETDGFGWLDSSYAIDKLSAEMNVLWYEQFGLKYVILRLGNVYSEYDTEKLTWRLFNSRKEFTLYAKRKVILRDYIYVGDVYDFVEKILEMYWSGELQNDIVNLGHEPTFISDIVDRFRELYGYPEIVKEEPSKVKEVEGMVLDCSRAYEYGWRPKIKLFDDGLKRIVDFFKKRVEYGEDCDITAY